MNGPTPSDCQLSESRPGRTARSNLARKGSTRGFSTGSTVLRTELFIPTTRSRLPVQARKVSADW